MKIGVIGAGRLGICFALLLDRAGFDVIASDVRESYIQNLQKGIIDTPEPQVQDLLPESNITFKVGNDDVIKECDILYTLVATPSADDGTYDVTAVDAVVDDIIRLENISGKSLVVGCTTNPGDCKRWSEKLSNYGVDVYYNPEFIAQGSIIKDLVNADMVLIGGKGKHSQELINIYYGIQGPHKEPSIHFMSTTSAEIVKLALNCYLTTKISYANMVGQVLYNSGLSDEIDNVLAAIGSDSRVGNKYLNFGFGFGGPCFPRDNRAFGKYAEKVGLKHNFGNTTDNFNNEHAKFIKNYFIKLNPEKLPFLFESIAYKKGTDILTESQQYRLCLDLLDEGYEIYVKDDRIRDRCDTRIKFGKPTGNYCMGLL
tara:strand:- start:404 stop:1516 length:1113 start_codon:yes stop_codon:yes gene_type:complete